MYDLDKSLVGVMCRYHRIEVLGALASVLSTWLVTGILLYEAVNRVINPSPVNGKGELLPRIKYPQLLTLCLSCKQEHFHVSQGAFQHHASTRSW